MKKYRIIEENNSGYIRFIPEYCVKYIPIWFRYKTGYTGYDHSDLAFITYQEAKDFLDNEMKQKIKISEIIHYL